MKRSRTLRVVLIAAILLLSVYSHLSLGRYEY